MAPTVRRIVRGAHPASVIPAFILGRTRAAFRFSINGRDPAARQFTPFRGAHGWEHGRGRQSLLRNQVRGFVMRKALSLVILTMLSGPALAVDSVPIESVNALAALDNNGGWRPIFDNTPTPLMRRYFSPPFNQAWTAAMKHNKDFPVFDADPLTGEQNGGGIKSVSAKMDGPSRVAATMTLNDGSERSVVFLMLHSAADEWFINDIIYPHQKSLRVVLDDAGR